MAKQNEQNEVETTTEVEATENATRQVVTDVTVDAEASGDIKSPEVEAEAGAGAPAEAAPELEAAAPTGAAADPATEAVAEAMGEMAPKKQSRKAKLKSNAATDEIAAAPDYAAYGLSEDEAQAVEALRLAYTELGRRSTEHVFECGAVMDAVHQIAPDQKAFGKLVKGAFGISRTGAENLARVHRNLREHRARLARLGIAASSLYVMATAETQRVEEVLVAAEAGEKLSVKRVKAMLGQEQAKPGAVPDDGGMAGFRARIAERTAIEVGQVMDEAEALLTLTLVTLEPHRRGRRIVVKDAQRPFIAPARILRKRIERTTWLTVEDLNGPLEGATQEEPITRDDRWYALWRTLADLGAFEGWPKAGEVGGWLADTVAAQLAWLLGDRAPRSHAVIAKMEAEAEAERIKAEQAKERAKADAKKAAEKAKRDKAKAEKQTLREARAAEKAANTADDAAVNGNADA